MEELAESIMKFQSLEISIPWPSDLDGDFQDPSFEGYNRLSADGSSSSLMFSFELPTICLSTVASPDRACESSSPSVARGGTSTLLGQSEFTRDSSASGPHRLQLAILALPESLISFGLHKTSAGK